jgi:hypothetical protein
MRDDIETWSRKRKLPPDADLKVLHFETGLTYKEIAIRYNVCTQCVDSRFRKMGYRKGHRKIPTDEELKVILSDETRSIKEKAKDLGVSVATLYNNSKRLWGTSDPAPNDDKYDRYIKDWKIDKNWTAYRIANKLHVSMEFVYARFKALDIPIRYSPYVTRNLEALKSVVANRELTYGQIAVSMGLPRSTVQRYALQWGFRREKDYPPVDTNLLISRYVNDLWSVNRIAREYGYFGMTVKKRLVELGLYRDAKSLWRARVEKRARDTGSAFQFQGSGYPVIPLPEGHVTRTNQWAGRRIVMAHIVEMEKKLGRPLEKHEKVHHINCRKDDFRIENLYLCKSNAEHMHIHGTIEKVVGMLWDAGIISFKPGYGYYLKKKPREEDLVDVPEPPEPEIAAPASDLST